MSKLVFLTCTLRIFFKAQGIHFIKQEAKVCFGHAFEFSVLPLLLILFVILNVVWLVTLYNFISGFKCKVTAFFFFFSAHLGRGRFTHVQSSGYGQLSPPQARKSSQPRSAGKSPPRVSGLKSPSDVQNKELTRSNTSSLQMLFHFCAVIVV